MIELEENFNSVGATVGGSEYCCNLRFPFFFIPGKNIDCYSHGGGASAAVNQYCWVTGTHLVPKKEMRYANIVCAGQVLKISVFYQIFGS